MAARRQSVTSSTQSSARPHLRVALDKFVHGGQAIGTMEDGMKALVWGALPGETVMFQPLKKPRSFAEGVATEIITPSPDRISPRDEAYMSTSPWQILAEKTEDQHKLAILRETFEREGVACQNIGIGAETTDFYGYRNKMEYSFYGDDEGVHLALFNRGTHYKQRVTGSSIARPEIDKAAQNILHKLNERGIRAGDLKTLVLRCSRAGDVVAALYVKREEMPQLAELASSVKGLTVVYSTPKSPASVRTRDLFTYGDISLTDTIHGRNISYDVFSFFQVNLPIFDAAVVAMAAELSPGEQIVDFYSGVGTIGLSLGVSAVLVELDAANISWAEHNATSSGATVVQAASENALGYVDGSKTLVVDPPRAGLHQSLVEHLCDNPPPKIIYLSCNPSTQARDIKRLEQHYDCQSLRSYNFFPRTPHIESLAILTKKVGV